MSVSVLTDTSCDMPVDWLDANEISCLPGIIKHRDYQHILRNYYDSRDDTFGRWLHDNGFLLSGSLILTDIPDRVYTQKWFNSTCNETGQYLFIAIDGALSASHSQLSLYCAQWRGLNPNGSAKVVDSKTALTGQGLIAWVAKYFLEHYGRSKKQFEIIGNPGQSLDLEVAGDSEMEWFAMSELDALIEYLKPVIEYQVTEVVVKDFAVIYSRGAKKLNLPVIKRFTGLAIKFSRKYPIFRAHKGFQQLRTSSNYTDALHLVFSEAADVVERGSLIFPVIIVSYAASEISALDRIDSFVRLKKVCSNGMVSLYFTRMSNAGAINLGMGAVSISYLAKHMLPTYIDQSVFLPPRNRLADL